MFSTMKMPEDMLPAYNLSKNVATEALEVAHAPPMAAAPSMEAAGVMGVTGVAADPRVPEAPRHVGRYPDAGTCLRDFLLNYLRHLILAARTGESAPSPIAVK